MRYKYLKEIFKRKFMQINSTVHLPPTDIKRNTGSSLHKSPLRIHQNTG